MTAVEEVRRRATFPNIVAGIVCLMMAFPLYWWIVDRQPAANSVSEILSKEVKQGEFLQIHYRLTWRSACKILAFRYVIDEMRVEWPISADERIVQPGPADFIIRVPIPLAAAPGEALYRATIRFECNPVQKFLPREQELAPRSFRILAGENASGGIQPMGHVLEGPPVARQFHAYGSRGGVMPVEVLSPWPTEREDSRPGSNVARD